MHKFLKLTRHSRVLLAGIQFLKILIISSLFLSSTIFALLELELTHGVYNRTPIAVVPFAGQENIDADESLTDTIGNDLKNSGRFRLVDIDAKFDEVKYNDWKSRKIEAVVVGKIQSIGGGRFLVRFKVLDVYNKNILFEKEYRIKKSQLRKFSHHVSDIVYEKFTGDRGIFSTKIAYILVERHGRTSKHRIQVADSDGYNPHTLVTSSFPIMSLTWSPDGKKIAYVSFEGNRSAIYIQDVVSGKRKILTKFRGINGAPVWSPDGKKMALVLTKTGYPKIHILDLATKKTAVLTKGYSLDTEPSWAPDGRSLIFTSNRGGTPQIYRIYLGNRKIERVTFNGNYNAHASFTPDGKSIVLLHKEGEMFTIALEDLKSRRVTLLTRSGLNESPSVAPNGKMVVYATNKNGQGILAEVSIDGRVKLLLPAGEGEVQEPAWSPFLK